MRGDSSLSLVFRRIVGIFFSQMFSNSTFWGKKKIIRQNNLVCVDLEK